MSYFSGHEFLGLHLYRHHSFLFFSCRLRFLFVFSGLLTPKLPSSGDKVKSKTNLSSTGIGLKTSGSPLLLPSSSTSLSLQGPGLLKQSSLSNPLLGTSTFKKLQTGSTFPSHPSLSSTLSRLSLKHDAPRHEDFSHVEKKNVKLGSNTPQTASSTKSVSRKRVLKSGDVTLKKKIVESKGNEATAVVSRHHTVKAPDYTIKSDREDEFEVWDQSKFAVSSLELQLTKSVKKSLTDVTALKVGNVKSFLFHLTLLSTQTRIFFFL